MTLLLLFGASGIGKTSIIRHLGRFNYSSIITYTTRKPRSSDYGKISLSHQEYKELSNKIKYLENKKIHGEHYFERKDDVEYAINHPERRYVLDMSPYYFDAYQGKYTFNVFLFPNDAQFVVERLRKTGRTNRIESVNSENTYSKVLARKNCANSIEFTINQNDDVPCVSEKIFHFHTEWLEQCRR